MATAPRTKRIAAARHSRRRTILPDTKPLGAKPATASRTWFFRRRGPARGSGAVELNGPVIFFALLIGVLVIFLAVAFVGAYYFTQRTQDDNISHNSLRNTSLLLTNKAAEYRINVNANTNSNENVNRPAACTSLTDAAACQARPDCLVEDLCNCDTVKARAEHCEYDLAPYEICQCEQGGFKRCIELVCPID